MSIKAILLDIEGTTSSLSYVKEVMFPYSKSKLKSFLKENAQKEEIKSLLKRLEEKVGKSLDMEEAAKILEDWIEKDLKEPILKELQGHIWEEGFKSGELMGHIYEDAYEKIKEWKQKGYRLYIYSSGSVKAQKLFFGNTKYGDLTILFDGFFDTSIGNKKDRESYLAIAKSLGIKPEDILFLSDVEEELDSASLAGMKTIRVDRYSNQNSKHRVIKSFFEVEL
ncbi:MAG: acireductone synthase [Aquificaceae bacterium]